MHGLLAVIGILGMALGGTTKTLDLWSIPESILYHKGSVKEDHRDWSYMDCILDANGTSNSTNCSGIGIEIHASHTL